MNQYTVGLIYRGSSWSPEPTPEVMRLQEAHLANIERLKASGDLLLAGPFGDDTDLRGIFVFKTASVDEARALVETDPAVRAGRLRIELHPWWSPDELT